MATEQRAHLDLKATLLAEQKTARATREDAAGSLETARRCADTPQYFQLEPEE